jgi:E3 ubiquitin-protein ligase BOI-like protein
MAVESHRLLLAQQGQGQKQFTNAAAAGWPWTSTGDEARCATAAARPSHHHQQQAAAAAFQFQQQAASCVGVGLPAPPPPVSSSAAPYAAAGGQVLVGDAAESGVTFGGGAGAAQHQEVVAMAMAAATAPRKRKRVVEQGQAPPVLEIGGAADVAAHFHQQLVDVDRLVLQHVSFQSPAVPIHASACMPARRLSRRRRSRVVSIQ